MKYIILFISFFIFTNIFFLNARDKLIVNAYNRPYLNLDGEWNYIVDPYETGFYNYRYEAYDNYANPAQGAYFMNSKPENKSDLVEYDFDKSEKIYVPGDWNSQNAELLYYEGTIWYKKSFDYALKHKDNRVFIYFGAVNYQADVYLNGKKLGRHSGGFTPFNFEVTDVIRKQNNFLILKVDNKRIKEGVPTLNTDWWNYGGITREVKVIETPSDFIRDYFIQLNPKNKNQIKGYVQLDGENADVQKITIKFEEMDLNKDLITNAQGKAYFNINCEKIKYWSPDNPYLYHIQITTRKDEVEDQIGFRSIKTAGNNIILNDKNIFLKGISVHEENPIRGGRAHSRKDALLLLNWAKELGCNYIRLAHYPHNENMIRIADKLGLLVWEEIPVYWTILWHNEETYLNAESQLTDIIFRDKNRASVIIWSMANETPVSDVRNSFLSRLASKTRNLDPTRLISAALEVGSTKENSLSRTIKDPFAEIVDVLSFNQYIGWYDGLPDKCQKINWDIKQDKPVIVSEFGAGAKYGYHGDKLTRWTEEYQEYVYTENLKMLGKIKQLQGLSPWILVDFRSPRRPLPGIQDGWNRKGLISDSGDKKKAYYVLKKFYDKKHILLDNIIK